MLNMNLWDIWNVLVFCVIPVLSVAIVFCVKRKHLWAAPLISTALYVIANIIVMPSILSTNEYRAMFFGICIPMHIVIAVILTVIAYIAAHILKLMQNSK